VLLARSLGARMLLPIARGEERPPPLGRPKRTQSVSFKSNVSSGDCTRATGRRMSGFGRSEARPRIPTRILRADFSRSFHHGQRRTSLFCGVLRRRWAGCLRPLLSVRVSTFGISERRSCCSRSNWRISPVDSCFRARPPQSYDRPNFVSDLLPIAGRHREPPKQRGFRESPSLAVFANGPKPLR
jgi:hypothetical protein